MLGIAERLAADRGLTYAFCDTDSMAFCDYYKKYSREDFRGKVKEITDWFQSLNPYKNDVRLFGFEKVNFKLQDNFGGEIVKGEFEPVYCLAVSSKRYCLFNFSGNGLPIIRKASAHGLGDVMLPVKDECAEPQENNEFDFGDIDLSQVDPDDLVLADVALTYYEARYEHYAAPLKEITEPDGTKKIVRQHGKLVAGSAAPLFLDMWYEAILELKEKGEEAARRCLRETGDARLVEAERQRGTLDGIDEVVCAWPELDAPQHSQTSLSTRDAWLHYQNLPNRRAFQFFETLPAPRLNFKEVLHEGETEAAFTARAEAARAAGLPEPTRRGEIPEDRIMFAEMKAAGQSSLYTSFSKPFQLDLTNLYRRDTNELIKPYLDEGMDLTTVADRVRGYFAHGEAKSEGKVGLLKRKCVVGLTKVWIGKESHPLADVEDLPDDETLEHYRASGEIVAGGVNHDLIVQAGIEKVAKAARVDEVTLVDAVLSQKALPEDAVDRIQAAIVINADTSIDVIAVPKTRQENAMDRVHRILNKGAAFKRVGKVHTCDTRPQLYA